MFREVGFEIVLPENIRNVKKEYFKDYFEEHVIELKNSEFLGEFEDWEDIENTPKAIQNFAECLNQIRKYSQIVDLKVIISHFAEIGASSKEVINVDADNVLNGLYLMSSKNYDVWTDNLILKLI